jgi:hypothetical protein
MSAMCSHSRRQRAGVSSKPKCLNLVYEVAWCTGLGGSPISWQSENRELDIRTMMKLSNLLLVVSALAIGVVGCGGAPAPPQNPTHAVPPPGAPPEPGPREDAAARPALTAQACEAKGGALVGDIGDGAIHRPEYRCPNGAKPIGGISAAEGGPIAIEGSVCCPH